MASAVKRFAILLALACTAYLALFLSPQLYFDDALRLYTHTSINQGVHGRPLADVLYSLFAAGFFMDFSPLSQIYALAFLLLAGTIAIRPFATLYHGQPSGPFMWGPLFFTLQPLFYSIIAFRFDSITISFGVLASTAAFWLTFAKPGTWRSLAAVPALWASLATYQPTIAFYYVFSSAYLANVSLRSGLSGILRPIVKIVGISLCAALCYLPIYIQATRNATMPFCGFPTHPYVEAHMGLATGLSGMAHGIREFLSALWGLLGLNPICLCLCLIALLAVMAIVLSQCHWRNKAMALALYVLSLPASGAALLALSSSVFPLRCLIPACAVALSSLLTASMGPRAVARCSTAIGIICIFLSASLITLYANASRDQEEYEQRVLMEPIWDDVREYLESHGDWDSYTYSVTGEPFSDHFSMRALKSDYPSLGMPTGSGFAFMRFMSWLPIRYNLPEAFKKVDYARCRLLHKRIGYNLWLAPGRILIIELTDARAPRFVAPYESARYFGHASKHRSDTHAKADKPCSPMPQ